MQHYDYIEWLLYKIKSLSKEKIEEMEEHLYNCDTCMEIFLSLIDEEEISLADTVIAEDFTENIINKISGTKVIPIKPVEKRKNFNYQLVYYAAIASVSIFLTMGGFFTGLVDAVPNMQVKLEINSELNDKNLINDFAEAIVKRTSKIIGSIENTETRDLRRNNDER